MELENFEPLFSDLEIHNMTAARAQSFTREDGGELMKAAVAYARKEDPDLEGDELMKAAFRLAYIRGYNHGIKAVSASWMEG